MAILLNQLPPTPANDEMARDCVVVRPDQISQPDERPWRRTPLHVLVLRSMLVSAALVVAASLGILAAMRVH